MKKLNITICLLLFSVVFSFSQTPITITQSDMPDPNDTLRVSTTIDFLTIDPELTGANYTWDFSTLDPQEQELKNFVDIDSTASFYQFYFNNPVFYPNFVATVAGEGSVPEEISSVIPITDPFFFFKESATAYKQIGLGASVSGFPLPIQYDSVDIIYNLPINYLDSDSCGSGYQATMPGFGYYRNIQKRVNYVDGWGTLTTPFGTFQTLRVKSVLYIQDSVYIEMDSSGFTNPRNVIEYKWLANGHHIPLLQIDAQVFFGVPVITNITYRDIYRNLASIEGSEAKGKISLFPNPATDQLFIHAESQTGINARVRILNTLGGVVAAATIADGTNKLDVSDLSPGIYFVEVVTKKQVEKRRFIKVD